VLESHGSILRDRRTWAAIGGPTSANRVSDVR
jgi:hypothetical protein